MMLPEFEIPDENQDNPKNCRDVGDTWEGVYNNLLVGLPGVNSELQNEFRITPEMEKAIDETVALYQNSGQMTLDSYNL